MLLENLCRYAQRAEARRGLCIENDEGVWSMPAHFSEGIDRNHRQIPLHLPLSTHKYPLLQHSLYLALAHHHEP